MLQYYFSTSDLEIRLLKELYKRYRKTKRRELWRATEAHAAINRNQGEDIANLHGSQYFSIELDGTHEAYQISADGIKLMDIRRRLRNSFVGLFFVIAVVVVILMLSGYRLTNVQLWPPSIDLSPPSESIPSSEAYIDTQTIYENSPTTPLEYLDLNSRGQLVPLPSETVEVAMQFGEAKGEENKIYMHRVVVMALDPSIRYTEGDQLGQTFKYSYDPNKLYTFYLPDGTDIISEDAAVNIISAGDRMFKVKLLSIDGRKDEQSRMKYIFRIEDITE